jgi:hypothetical protein
MVRPGPPQEPREGARSNEDLAVLYADCIEAFRRGATQEVWGDIGLRICELEQQLQHAS